MLRETLILSADVSSWLKLEAILEASADDDDDADTNNLLAQVRYKLWLTGNRDSPY